MGLAPPEVVFRIWTLPLMWLIIAAFLIAAAVTKSGLAQRVAYFFMIRYATSYRSLIVLTYVLGLVLSLLIPHPFPRVLLTMAVIRTIIQKAKMNQADAACAGAFRLCRRDGHLHGAADRRVHAEHCHSRL